MFWLEIAVSGFAFVPEAEDQFSKRSVSKVAYNLNKLLCEVDRLFSGTPRMRLAEIADSLGVARHTIENAMRARRKTTFREYRRRKLLHAARKMLEQPHLSVKEIGIKLGFASAASFSRFISQAAGKSPSRLRNEGAGSGSGGSKAR